VGRTERKRQRRRDGDGKTNYRGLETEDSGKTQRSRHRVGEDEEKETMRNTKKETPSRKDTDGET
jgi:hypothetical protein